MWARAARRTSAWPISKKYGPICVRSACGKRWKKTRAAQAIKTRDEHNDHRAYSSELELIMNRRDFLKTVAQTSLTAIAAVMLPQLPSSARSASPVDVRTVAGNKK